METYTLRELIIYYQQRLLDDWDQTTMVYSAVINNTLNRIALKSKSKVKERSFLDLHPFRQAKPTGARIGAKNFQALKYLAMAMRRK